MLFPFPLTLSSTITVTEDTPSAQELLQQIIDFLRHNGSRLIWVVIFVLLALTIVRYLLRLIDRILARSRIESTFHGFVRSIIKALLLVVIAIIVLGMLDIDTAPLIAALGAVGLAASLAAQDSLANFAGGISLLATKPFTVGDFIEMSGVTGTVREINLFHTVLITPDNKRVFLPNTAVSSSTLINYTAEGTRRLDLTFSIAYDADLDLARSLILQSAAASGMALEEPAAPWVDVSAHAAHSVDLLCHVWVESGNYLPMQFFLLEAVKRRFDANGISIPFPQLDVHMSK